MDQIYEYIARIQFSCTDWIFGNIYRSIHDKTGTEFNDKSKNLVWQLPGSKLTWTERKLADAWMSATGALETKIKREQP